MTRKERIEELMEDGTQYCCYCGDNVSNKFQCCGEIHFETFSEMDKENQDNFIAHEEFDDETN